MGLFNRKPKVLTPEQAEEIYTKDFFDMILPSTIKFFTDYYIVGDSYRSVWAVREYPPSTEEQAILSQLADRNGVTLRIYHRLVETMEQRKIIQNATRKNKLKSSGNDVNETIEAQGNLQDVVTLMANLRKNKEPLLHCSVFIELKAKSKQKLKELQTDIAMELTRSKIEVDRLTLRQKEGFLSVNPIGSNQFGLLYERVLPASSVANLFPFNFSGKTDPNGLYIGRDKYGTNILVDFDRRTEDKTTSNILILGNSGQGKSYLLKLILTNIRESGKKIICLDPESEYEDMTNALGGCYIDFMSGKYKINPLEPKAWNEQAELAGNSHTNIDSKIDFDSCEEDLHIPEAFTKVTRLSQHIAFLKDFFRTYKNFTDAQLDTIEILLMKLYARFGITDSTDYSAKKPSDFPVMSDFYDLCEEEYMTYDRKRKYLYTEEVLQEVCLGIHSMCVGSESKYFNGHTNITDDSFLCFGVKGLLDTNKRLKDAMLFNILSYMSNKLLDEGNTVASIDELYLFLSNLTAIEYIRNAMKRVRKKDSAVILASQNIDDFLIPSVKEYTKPLFSIPIHHFLFFPGNINPKDFEDALMVEPNEYALIKFGERGTCLYRCGNERYLLLVQAPKYKSEIFGSAGGR
jgi:type IV secretory pathway VirB4 component